MQVVDEGFETKLPAIEQILLRIRRRNRLGEDEFQDFRSYAFVKLLDNECRRLRAFGGRSAFSTFLTTLLNRLLMDYRCHRWGKWRPSAAAKRFGSAAVALETLLFRDGYEVHHAREALRANSATDLSDEQFDQLIASLPRRVRCTADATDVENLPGPCDLGRDRQRRQVMETVESAIGHALAQLEESDRDLVRLRFEHGLSIPRIAARTGVPSARLYGRLRCLMQRFRKALESRGIRASDAADLIGWSGFTLRLRA